ncbi:unnamed protein product [Malus baccata var. baccata]
MAADNRTIKELSALGVDNEMPLCIQYLMAAQGKTDEFELKSSLLHHILKYHGLSMEDPNKHLKEFEVVCSSITPVNVDGSILKMKAFPFSLMDKAKDWLYELAPGTVTSWENMKRAFLEKFFPTSRVIFLRKRISGIQHNQGESFPTYYECFKTFVASCPQHQMKEELLIQYFYEGLLPIERQMLDASTGSVLVDKTLVAAKTLIANRAHNAQQHEGVGQREGPRQHNVNEVSVIYEIQSQLANLTSLVSQVVIGSKAQENQVCTVCSIQGHLFEKCPQLIENGGWESANAIRFQGQNQTKYDPYSNTYNPGWRDHPNMKWKEPQQPAQQRGFRQNPLGFHGPINQINHLRPNVEQAITLRSGKKVGKDSQPSKSAQMEDEKLHFEEENHDKATTRNAKPLSCTPTIPNPSNLSTTSKKGSNSINSNPIPPNVPFPRRFMQTQKEESEKDILEAFRKVQVNIPLLDAIKQIPKYAKFLKKLCITRKWIREKEVVHVSENVFAMLQRKLPPKCKDPGSFTIPCVIGNTRFEHAMLDLDFYVLDMEDSDHSPPSSILLGRPFMKTAQTKIDVAKGALTMVFGGNMINFKIHESIENPTDVRSCFSIDVIKDVGQENSAPIKKEKIRTTKEEGIGMEHKEHTTNLKMHNLAKSTIGESVDSAATSLQHIGESSNPIPIPISTNRLLPSLVQVPNRIHNDGSIYIDFRKLNATIRKDHYPLPFIEPNQGQFEENVMEETPPYVVGSSQV